MKNYSLRPKKGGSFLAFAGLTLLLLLLTQCGGGGGISITTETHSAGDTTTIADNTELVFNGSESTVTIPANAFGEMTVTMKEGTVDTSDLEDDDLTPISTSVRLEFSEAETTEADESISVSILLDETEMLDILDQGLGVYAQMRIIGNRVDGGEDGESDSWFILMGTYDYDTHEYTVPVFATAAAIEIVIVSGDPPVVYTTDDYEEDTGESLSALFPNVVSGYDQLSWAVTCEKQKLDEADQGKCTHGSDDFVLDDIVAELAAASARLSNAGWSRANIATSSRVVINMLNGVRDRVVEFGETRNAEDIEPRYLEAYYTGDSTTMCIIDAAGCYSSSGGRLEFTTAASVVNSGNTVNNTFIHELFHAVQAVEIPNIHNPCITEATATAVEAWDRKNEIPASTMAARNELGERDWREGLCDATNSATPYLTSEFYTSLADGDMSYLQHFFAAISTSNSSNPLTMLDDALSSIDGVNTSIQELYVEKIVARRAEPTGYSYCSAPPFSEDTGLGGANDELVPFSSHCFHLETELDDDECITVSLPSGETAEYQRLLVNGEVVEEDTITLDEGILDIAVADVDLDRDQATPDNYSMIIIKSDEGCEHETACFPNHTSCYVEEGEDSPFFGQIACAFVIEVGDCSAALITCYSGGICLNSDDEVVDMSDPQCWAVNGRLNGNEDEGTYDGTSVEEGQGCGGEDLCQTIVICGQ